MTVPPEGTQPPDSPQPEPFGQPEPPSGEPLYSPAQPYGEQPASQPPAAPPPGPQPPGAPPLGPVPPGGPPYQPGYPAPPPKKSNTLRTVLIIGAVVVVLCCAGLAAGGVWLAIAAKNEFGPARDAAVVFVKDLEARNVDGAYSQLCTATQARFSRQDLAAVMASQPRIVSHKVTGVSVHRNGDTTTDVTMKLTDENGGSGHHTFHMVKQNGTWYVCGNPY